MTNPYELAEYIATAATIPAPVRRVWPLFLDMNRWYTDYRWEWVSGPPYGDIGLQEGQVLKASPLYGAGLLDASLFYYQEQLKVTKESEIVVKLTADNPESMSADYGATVRDLVAFYHWHFSESNGATVIAIRSYSNIRTDIRPSRAILAELEAAFHSSWSKCLQNLADMVKSGN
jgi:hypothetical protein